MFDLLEFNIDNSQDTFNLARRALVFVEGKHKDSMGRVHDFTVDRIKKFVDNTNNFLRQGGRLPFQLDHKKTQDFNIGDVEGELYLKEITEGDLPNKMCKHLVGKVGVFVDNIIGRGKDTVEKIKSGAIKTLSPGLDPMTESFIEVSATPTPAIIGPALFSKDGVVDNLIEFEYVGAPNIKTTKESVKPSDTNSKTFSFDDLYNSKKSLNKLKDSYEELSDDLFSILQSIHTASDEELAAEGVNPIEASYDAIEFFLSSLEDMFGLVEDEQEDIRKNYMAGGSQKFPVGKQPSDYSGNNSNALEFKKKIIGFVFN